MSRIVFLWLLVCFSCVSSMAFIPYRRGTETRLTGTFIPHEKGRIVPPDISRLPAHSLVREKYEKMFEIIPKPVRNWLDKKYAERKKYLDSDAWKKNAKRNLAEKLRKMHGRLDKEPAVSEEEVIAFAEEMLTYGRGLAHGSFEELPTFYEMAQGYGFTEVAKFLKKALDVDRYEHRGMEEVYPETDSEFVAFDTLAQELNGSEWKEFRRRWTELNEKFEANLKTGKVIRKTPVKAAAKPGRGNNK